MSGASRMFRTVVRGGLWLMAGLQWIASICYSVAGLMRDYGPMYDHYMEMRQQCLLSAVSTMVLFLCVPQSPLYLPPADEVTP